MADYLRVVAGPQEYLKSQVQDNNTKESHIVVNQKISVGYIFDTNLINERLRFYNISDIPLNTKRLLLKGYSVNKDTYVFMENGGGGSISVRYQQLLLSPFETVVMSFGGVEIATIVQNVADISRNVSYYHPIHYQSLIQSHEIYRSCNDLFDTEQIPTFLSFYVENDYSGVVAAGTDFAAWLVAINLLLGVAGFTLSGVYNIYNICAYFKKIDE